MLFLDAVLCLKIDDHWNNLCIFRNVFNFYLMSCSSKCNQEFAEKLTTEIVARSWAFRRLSVVLLVSWNRCCEFQQLSFFLCNQTDETRTTEVKGHYCSFSYIESDPPTTSSPRICVTFSSSASPLSSDGCFKPNLRVYVWENREESFVNYKSNILHYCADIVKGRICFNEQNRISNRCTQNGTFEQHERNFDSMTVGNPSLKYNCTHGNNAKQLIIFDIMPWFMIIGTWFRIK